MLTLEVRVIKEHSKSWFCSLPWVLGLDLFVLKRHASSCRYTHFTFGGNAAILYMEAQKFK